MTHDHPTPVTVLGLGPMGRALAGAFLANGHPTTVWNRTAARAEDLVARGAIRADTVADALKGRTLVNLTADTPERARLMAAWAAELGVDYLDGAIMTPTPTIGGPAAL
ncbi:NAD(P)-binding domain-containing protein [Streptosporangium sp. LJ11]|uniref:NAD(P)-binding domain-containing protein n=1 Tax=Streptosporangium sp. LJ11 TaxID=3436927 RepID=UPI003F78D5FF